MSAFRENSGNVPEPVNATRMTRSRHLQFAGLHASKAQPLARVTVAASLCLNPGVFDDRPPFLGVGLHERAERRPQIGFGAADVWRCYGASVAPVLAAAAEMFLGAWQHGIVGEYPVNLYLKAPWVFPKTVLSSPAVYRFPLVSTPRRCPMLELPV